mmetsp:Transcript_15818/g.34290  ORF Transcript_15818/g.34290 Transcript_15818/m.34290 type:complete len:170 (-) Transcript_15818:77-586(-)|eukprot:CAMPEP_0118929590 /NCGR_PEP_ID=MMETSP1169-20130426/6542_1 /TAXON_ID=36882 /ORGANISM="Pyramimonas obovata, Strain CCMP722" /LENGTH=169 /DNA_ID=CAMNT_0006871807 /DNA_START=39 /DNA_END=548 /DNA_ORIENTATION=-
MSAAPLTCRAARLAAPKDVGSRTTNWSGPKRAVSKVHGVAHRAIIPCKLCCKHGADHRIDESTERRKASKAELIALSMASCSVPGIALADDGSGFSFVALGKLGIILLVADLITGIVLGKNVFKMLSGSEEGGGGDWKEKVADSLMEKMKEKEASEKEASEKEAENKEQ